MRDSIKLIAAFGFLAATAAYAGLVNQEAGPNKAQGKAIASSTSAEVPKTMGAGIPDMMAIDVVHSLKSAGIAQALEVAGLDTNADAEPLKHALNRLAARHGINVSGAHLLEGDAPEEHGEGLNARLAALLAGYNHILVRGNGGAVSRIVIVSAKDHYTPPSRNTVASVRSEPQGIVQVASVEQVPVVQQVRMVEPAPTSEREAVTRRFLVYFDFDSARVSTRGKETIREALDFVREHKSAQVNLAGYADRAGTESYNHRLSAKRASAVAAAFGMDAGTGKTLAVTAFGERNAAVPTADGVAEPRNRRVEIVISA